MNTPQQKSGMSSSTMKTLKLCQDLGLQVSIIDGDSTTAAAISNIQEDVSITRKPTESFSTHDESLQNVTHKHIPSVLPDNKNTNMLVNKPNKNVPFPSESKAPVVQYRVLPPTPVPRVAESKASNSSINQMRLVQESKSGVTMKTSEAFSPQNEVSQNVVVKHTPSNLVENKNINVINRLNNKSVPFSTEGKLPLGLHRTVPMASRPVDIKVVNQQSVGQQRVSQDSKSGEFPSENFPILSPVAVVTPVQKRAPISRRMASSNAASPAKKKCISNIQSEPNNMQVKDTAEQRMFNLSAASSTMKKNVNTIQPEPNLQTKDVAEQQSPMFNLPASHPLPAKKKCIVNAVQSEMGNSTFDPSHLQTNVIKEGQQTPEFQKFYSLSVGPPAKKKCVVNTMQSEIGNKPFEPNNIQMVQSKEGRQTPEHPKLYSSVPSSMPAKKKAINTLQSEAASKSFDSINMQTVSAKDERQTSDSTRLFNLPSLSPGLTITPVVTSTPKMAVPISSSITCKIVNDPSQQVKDYLVLCPHCKTPSRNLAKCDNCNRVINRVVYNQMRQPIIKKKSPQPIVLKNLTVTNQIIYPNLQLQDGTHMEQLRVKQSVTQSQMLRSPRAVTLNQKPKPKARRRYVEPVCLTISSDEEEPMQHSFIASPEESSSLPYQEESDPSKSENSSAGEMNAQNLQDMDDLEFPGVTDMHGNPEEPDGEYDEEEPEDYGMEDEMEELEEDEELEEEEEFEEEEIEDEEDEVPPDEDQDEEEMMNMEARNDPRAAVSSPICCRSIRIGSFKIHPRNDETFIPIYLNNESFIFQVPTVDNPAKIVTLQLRSSDILQTLCHFGRCLPIMFIFTTPGCADHIRNVLHMTKTDNQYFDPSSNDEKTKRITFLIDSCSDAHRNHLRTMFPGDTRLKEIDQKSANEILVKSTPSQPQIMIKCQAVENQPPPTDSQVQMTAPVTPTQQQLVVKPQPALPVTKILTYPPPPQTGGIAITSEDMACLNEGEFLNDAIIDFYLKYVFYEKLSEYHREKTHIFSSYFYPRLTQKPLRPKPGDDAPKSMQVKRHGQVKTWTRHVDIFSKDYIIIPINQNVHWFLAIICFPGRVPEASSLPPKQEPKAVNKIIDTVTSTNENEIANKPIVTPKSQVCGDEGSNQTQEEMSNSPPVDLPPFELEEPPDPEDPNPEVPDSSTHPDGNPRRREKPCICIFDSLSGPNRWRIAATLREYLDMEWRIKKNTKRVFDRNTMQGFVLQCPQQTNFSDCGLYVLQYVESFFQNPLSSFGSPMPDLSTWFTEQCVSTKREQLKTLILQLQKRQQSNQQNQPAPIVTTRLNISS